MEVKKQDWRTYEQLAETIYRKLDPAAVVKHDDSIYGYDTEEHRQIDVSIRSKVAGHDILVIVQARDWKRAPNVNNVGEFADVVRDVRAHKGVMICRKPPGKNAAILAKKRNIEMCSAFDVNDHKWSEEIAVPVVVSLVEGELHPDFTFAQESGGVTIGFPFNTSQFFVSIDSGRTSSTLLDYMNNHVVRSGLIESGTREFVVENDDLCLLLNKTEWVPLPHLLITAVTRVRKLFRHCKASEYLALKNYSTGELTVAQLKLELPPFNNSNAWQDGTNVQPYEHVTENVPAVQLQLSNMAPARTIGVRVLPLSDRANW